MKSLLNNISHWLTPTYLALHLCMDLILHFSFFPVLRHISCRPCNAYTLYTELRAGWHSEWFSPPVCLWGIDSSTSIVLWGGGCLVSARLLASTWTRILWLACSNARTLALSKIYSLFLDHWIAFFVFLELAVFKTELRQLIICYSSSDWLCAGDDGGDVIEMVWQDTGWGKWTIEQAG